MTVSGPPPTLERAPQPGSDLRSSWPYDNILVAGPSHTPLDSKRTDLQVHNVIIWKRISVRTRLDASARPGSSPSPAQSSRRAIPGVCLCSLRAVSEGYACGLRLPLLFAVEKLRISVSRTGCPSISLPCRQRARTNKMQHPHWRVRKAVG